MNSVKGNNIVDLHPMPDCLNLSREAWATMNPVLRDEIIRAWQELLTGQAIQKDRYCGRGKRALGDSFYALHLMDMDCWRRPDAKKIAEADALRERLAPDAVRVQTMLERDADLAEFHELAKKGGTTVAVALREYVDIENILRRDPIMGLKILARKCGLDLVDIAMRIAGHPDAREAI